MNIQSKLLFLLFITCVVGLATSALSSDTQTCTACVQLMSNDIIINTAKQGCEECSSLSAGFKDLCQRVCTLPLVQELSESDPIQACQSLSMCPAELNSSANITILTVNPAISEYGDTLKLDVEFKVTSPIGTGQLVFETVDPNGKKFGQKSLLISVANGVYKDSYSFTFTNEKQYPSGFYWTWVSVCEGTCGSVSATTLSKHSTSYMLSGPYGSGSGGSGGGSGSGSGGSGSTGSGSGSGGLYNYY
ncbi:hypothetical protein CYY_000325 [Polysphondylium violaceum]|uniref:Countin-like protein n=1 Tax=Polysphondylium violaceum TaxID=133409 RepID=A0A8J4QB29_9MYCE|nr:hypothetical protein CYY_000325 [Polysphondylium violaceum]